MSEEIIPSPCQSICLLNDEDVCVGCGRTGMEVSYWGRFDNQAKQQVVNHAAQRLAGADAPCVWQLTQSK